METETIVCNVSRDGYLFGASDRDSAYHSSYWRYDSGDIVAVDIPSHILDSTVTEYTKTTARDALLNHGTSGQWFDDGYDAWQFVLRNATRRDK